MGRPGYMSIYADEKIQKIFDEFIKSKGITKAAALTEMLEIYMISQDEELYLNLKKEVLNIETAKQMLIQRGDVNAVNDYIFIKLGYSMDVKGKEMDGEKTIQAYINNIENNGMGYTWFSTQSLHFGMAKKKVDYYNKLIQGGGTVKMLFAIGGDINDICYSARIEELLSDKDQISCPDVPEAVPEEFGVGETARIWIKLSDIKKETNIKAAMLRVRSTDANLKQVISNSQFHFGYVYLQDETEGEE